MNPEQTIIKMTDSLLISIGHMAMKKSKDKRQYEHDIETTQYGIDWLKWNAKYPLTDKIKDVLKFDSVQLWADDFESNFGWTKEKIAAQKEMNQYLKL